MTYIVNAVVVWLALLMPGLAAAQSNPALAGQSVVTEIDGARQTREYALNGTLIYEVVEREVKEGGKTMAHVTEREWFDNGKPARDQEFLGGTEMKGTLWYMNGKVKETRVDQSIHDPDGMPGSYTERFSDLGVLQSAGVFQGQFRPVGTHRHYDEAGTLIREVTYGPDGAQRASKTFNAQGAPQDEAQYYPDGSRKIP